MGSARDNILQRIDQALSRQSPDPHWAHEPTLGGSLFPPPADTDADRRRAFANELATLFGEVVELPSVESAQQWIRDWCQKESATSILAPDGTPLATLLSGLTNVILAKPDGNGDPLWSTIPVGITPAFALIAESASVIVNAGLCGRSLSVLPPTHIVVASSDQLLPTFDQLFPLLRQEFGDTLPSNVSIITGPSRTADIEKILVLGAHGPKKLIVLLLPAGSLPGVPVLRQK